MSCTTAEAVALGLLRPHQPRRRSLREWLGLQGDEKIQSGAAQRVADAYRVLHGTEPPQRAVKGSTRVELLEEELDACLAAAGLELFELRA